MGRRAFLVLVLNLVGAVLTSGCGGGPGSATVGGEVAADGKPLGKGVITFTGPDGKSATANVENGKYTLRTTPGNNRVQISAPVVTGTRKESTASNAPTIEITEESLPDRYNAKSDLTLDVKPGGNTKDWVVETKKRK